MWWVLSITVSSLTILGLIVLRLWAQAYLVRDGDEIHWKSEYAELQRQRAEDPANWSLEDRAIELGVRLWEDDHGVWVRQADLKTFVHPSGALLYNYGGYWSFGLPEWEEVRYLSQANNRRVQAVLDDKRRIKEDAGSLAFARKIVEMKGSKP